MASDHKAEELAGQHKQCFHGTKRQLMSQEDAAKLSAGKSTAVAAVQMPRCNTVKFNHMDLTIWTGIHTYIHTYPSHSQKTKVSYRRLMLSESVQLSRQWNKILEASPLDAPVQCYEDGLRQCCSAVNTQRQINHSGTCHHSTTFLCPHQSK